MGRRGRERLAALVPVVGMVGRGTTQLRDRRRFGPVYEPGDPDREVFIRENAVALVAARDRHIERLSQEVTRLARSRRILAARNRKMATLVLLLLHFYHDFDGGEHEHSQDHKDCVACDALCEAMLR